MNECFFANIKMRVYGLDIAKKVGFKTLTVDVHLWWWINEQGFRVSTNIYIIANIRMKV
jgi:hypothetical protein